MQQEAFNPCELVFIVNTHSAPAKVKVVLDVGYFEIELDAYDAVSFISAFYGLISWSAEEYPGIVVRRIKLEGCKEVNVGAPPLTSPPPTPGR